MKRAFLAAIVALCLGASGYAEAQSYPKGTVTLIVPFTAGGGGDVVARTLAPKLEKELGVSVIVENKTGGAGVVGVSAVRNAAPNGHTLLVGYLQQFTQLPQLRSTPYTMKDFIPVYHVAKAPVMFFGRSALPFDDIKGLVEYAKKNPGQLRVGTSGSQSASDIDLALLKEFGKIDVVVVPYQGAVQAVTGLLGDEIDVYAAIPSVAFQHVEAGKLKFLGSQSPERFPLLPNTPTLREVGFDMIDEWTSAIFVHKDTPKEIVDKLEKSIAKAARTQEVRDILKANYLGEHFRTSEETKAEMEAEYAFWKNKLESIGMIK